MHSCTIDLGAMPRIVRRDVCPRVAIGRVGRGGPWSGGARGGARGVAEVRCTGRVAPLEQVAMVRMVNARLVGAEVVCVAVFDSWLGLRSRDMPNVHSASTRALARTSSGVPRATGKHDLHPYTLRGPVFLFMKVVGTAICISFWD